ncbi:DUF1542 domain-containing protein [Staphylococcus pasteuri]|uniref:DUF1542 domain-containing protein n=1 Tax=Staphylococcus pasteuri TaxID=45972 RepID=UPI003BB6CB4D
MEDALIDSESTRTAVNNDLNEAQALDQLMDILRQSVADKDEIHANSQYINAEPNKQQDFDTALQNAENIIAGTNNPTINKGDVSQATQAVDNAKQALDGVQRLEEDKQNAGTSLNQFDHLTPAQQQALENAINNASTRDEVAQKLAEAQALNNAMQALKDSIQDHAQVEASSKFINEDPTQKGAYTDAVNNALDIINNDSNPTLDKSAIEQATQAVNNAKDNLHGDQKLADDKQHANKTLNQLNNLNTAQRDTLQNQINGASTRDEVAQIINHAQALDLAMENLKESIKDQAQTEASSKFINEDPAQKDAYTQAVQHAQELIDQTSNPTLDITKVDQLTQAVNNAKDNLHGDQKLEQAKQRALESLNNSTDLNQPQRQTLETQINQATTRDDINQILVNAADLNTAMGNLKASINDQAQVEASSKFINEDPAQKDAYTEAVTNAKDLINQTSNPTMDTNQIEQKIQDVINAKDNLHGDQKLEQDQQQATTTVDSLDHLNHAQQQATKDAIAGATTRTEVAQLVQTATQLDQVMKSLKDQLNQINTDKAEPNYTEASIDKQDALNQAISNAENIVNPAQGTNANQTEVEQALTQLQQTANDLNGDQRVADAKAQAKTDIDQLTHLNNEQQTAIKQNIDNATQLQPIAQIVEQATQLNTAMQQLQDAVNDHTNVENSVDYSQADNDKQQAYQQAITHAQQLLTENASQQQVEQAYQDIQQTKQALNGDERVAEAKTQANQAIDQLNAINDSQHQSLVERVNQSNDLNEIQQIVDEATSLNTVMNQLKQTINDNEASTKNSGNYINAEAQLKRDFDQAITNAQDAVDKANGLNLPKEQIQQLIDAISTTKDALNGDQRLSDAKTKALETLDQLTNINNAQKQLATLQIDNADTLNNVTRAINKATAVDQAMNALKQYVQNNELPIKSSSNFINADDDLKAQFNKAITNAQNVLNKDSGNALTNTEVEALKQAIIDAENALNGDLKVTNAKSKADKFIVSLDQLNQPQKVAAHEAIKKANDLDTINDIINDQIELNDAMAELRDLVENTIPNSENSIDFQNADQSAKDNLNEVKSNAQQMLDGNNNNDTDVNDVRGMIESIKEAINQLNGEERLQEAKNDAIQEVNKALADKLKEINASNATEQDKTDAINKAKELANQIINDINNSTSNDQVNKVQQSGNKAIDEIHANEIPKAKIDAKNDIEQKINDLITKITNNPDLTDTEKQQLINQLNQLKQQSNNDIDNATTKEDIDRIKQKLEDAVNNISNYVKAKVDAKNEIKDAAAAKIKEIDNNPDLTPEQKAAAKDEVNRLKEQALKDIDNAKDLSGIDEAKSNAQDTINQFDPNQFTIDQAKDKAKQAIEEAANNKLKEIDNNPDLTPEQKAAAKNEVNRLKDQALKDINNAKDLTGIDKAKSQAQDTINQFDPNQFTIDQAKDKAKQAIEDAANNKLKEIDNNPDLTPEQKAAAKDEVNRLKDQALKDIDNSKSLEDITKQQHKFISQIISVNPIKDLVKRKDDAIKNINKISTQKAKDIRNSRFGTASQKQDALNRINSIVNDTIRRIKNAHTPQEVDDALRDGINRILAVQINTNIGRNRNQFNNTLNRPFDLTRVVRANQTNATTIFGNGSKEKLNGSVPSDKSKQSKDKNNNHQNTHSVTDSIANVLKKTLGFVGISGLLASFWFVMAKRRRKEEEDEMLNHKDTIKDDKKHLLSDNDHEPLLLAKQKKDETETNKQSSNSSKEKKLKGNDKDAPILIAKKKQNRKDNENKAKGKSTSNNKKVTNSKKKKKNNKKPSKRKK